VYILILPSFGIISEVLPVFSRKPLFGYKFVAISGAAIGFVGWGVWAHHMFASGLGPISVLVFSMATMMIAVPTGVKIINWTLTMWGGKLRFTTAMLFAIGLIIEFTIGDLSGVTHAVAPSDTQQTDTYYVVAHFHYVLFGGAIFGLFSGFYYWWPKMFSRLLNETWGKINFWLMVIGMNLTFGPMHIIGLQGQPRRMYRYDTSNVHTAFWNAVSSVGAFVIALGILAFIVNVIITQRSKRPEVKAPLDPWDARSLEWMTSNPPAAHNFDAIPTIHELDEFFHRKYAVDHETGEIKQVATAEQIMAEQLEHAESDIHLPSPSYWPMILSFSLPIIGFGVIYSHILMVVGGAIAIMAIFGWSMEPSVAPKDDYEPPAPTDSNLKELTA
jgi:cytochrome c oxidase subunit 1